MPDDIDELERKADSRLTTYHLFTVLSVDMLMAIVWFTIYQSDRDPKSIEYAWGVPAIAIALLFGLFIFGVAHKRPLTGFWISADSLVFWRGAKILYFAGPLTILMIYVMFEIKMTHVCFILWIIVPILSAIVVLLFGNWFDEPVRKRLGARNRFYRGASVASVSKLVERALAELGIDHSTEEINGSGNPYVVFTLAGRPIKLKVGLEEKWDGMVLIAMSGGKEKYPEEDPKWRGIEIAIHKLSGNMGM